MNVLLIVLGAGLAWGQPAQVREILDRSCVACHNASMAQGKLRLDREAAISPAAAKSAAARLTTADRALRMPPGMTLPPADVAAIEAWAQSQVAMKVDFVKDVQPIFKASCYGCHSGGQPKAQLRLDAKSVAMRVITPGAGARSRLIHRVEGQGGEKRMPLSGEALTGAQIATLRAWIDSGAVWPAEADIPGASIEKHWSYRKPVKPAPPAVKNTARVRNPIDAFVLARLEKQGLAFSPEASKETLIRRLSLDLTGLPPSPKEVAGFVADSRANAYELLVERLLASSHYGERWARPWLDLARYADTNGYEKDRRRMMWKYRDWVIGAFNHDMPFDQFTIEQIAGDMLPNATDAQKIASGFHRNTMYNEEGGVDKEEAHFEVLVDRVNTTGSVWLATSLTCTQCHNHKYDPFTQKEYYQLMAFFNNTVKQAQEYGDTSVKWREAELDLATPDQEQRRAAIRKEIAAVEKKLKTSTPALEAEQRVWEKQIRAAAADWQVLTAAQMESASGAKFAAESDGAILVSGENAMRETYRLRLAGGPREITGLRIEALPHASLPRQGPGRDIYGNFLLTDVRVEAGGEKAEFARVLSDDGRSPDTRTNNLWYVDASRDEKRMPRQLVLVFRKPLRVPEDGLRVSIDQFSDFLGQGLGHFRVSSTAAKDPSTIVKVRARFRSLEPSRELAEFYRSIAPSLAADRDRLKELRSELDKMDIVTALVMKETGGADRPFDFVRTRGMFASKADKVLADVPASLHPMNPADPPNRLGLARWLASKENPLTARVAVNRIWEQYFGRGIVETSEDFGSQGERPTHPELLDWLAAEFMDRGWSMKAMHRLIVTSSAYRQDSHATPELLQADPYNKLIARGPRFRMEAEMIRDAALVSSGLFSAKVGGPSVFPPQPPGVWDIPYSDDKWEESTGEDKHRRGLYTFIRRSALYPAMVNFDATSREVCAVRRVRTNTPLQALTTLNDEAFFEMAKSLGARLLREGGDSDRARVDYGMRLVTARPAKPVELDRMLSWLEGERAYFRAHPDEAKKLGGGDLEASYTMLANVLLNLDEALTKE
jgi:mono/diheme cytochrome c family protein